MTLGGCLAEPRAAALVDDDVAILRAERLDQLRDRAGIVADETFHIDAQHPNRLVTRNQGHEIRQPHVELVADGKTVLEVQVGVARQARNQECAALADQRDVGIRCELNVQLALWNEQGVQPQRRQQHAETVGADDGRTPFATTPT